MTGEQFVELWFGSLFCGWDFLGENTALTYFSWRSHRCYFMQQHLL